MAARTSLHTTPLRERPGQSRFVVRSDAETESGQGRRFNPVHGENYLSHFRLVAAGMLSPGRTRLRPVRPFLRSVHHGNDFNVLADPIRDDVRDVGQYDFARACDATDASSCRQLYQHIDGRHKPGNDPCSSIWFVKFEVRTAFRQAAATPARSSGRASAS